MKREPVDKGISVNISVVIPTYNRVDNLKLVLAALEAQKYPPAFEVIIADDGSTDGTREYFNIYSPPFPVKYIWCGPNQGFRTPRTRNIGFAQASAPHVLLLDSDVLLNPHALAEYEKARMTFPDVVFVGMYHWSGKGRPTIEQILESYDHVEALVPDQVSAAPPVPGKDARHEGFHTELTTDNVIFDYDGLGFFSGNILWPVAVWWALRGQNEKMPNGVGEDAEMGQRMRMGRCLIPLLEGSPDMEIPDAIKECLQYRSPQTAIPVFQYEPVYGIHLYHERNVPRRQRLVQESIAFIDRLYEIGTYEKLTDPETDPREKDLSIWYTRKQGARLVRKEDEATVYAVDGVEKNYVGLPTPKWYDLLGFSPNDVEIVDGEYLESMEYKGTIRK